MGVHFERASFNNLAAEESSDRKIDFNMNSNCLCFGILLFTVQMAVSMFPPEIADACKKETGFDKHFSEMDFKDSSFPKEAKCFLSCGLQKLKVLKEDGSLDKDTAIAHVEKFMKNEEKKTKIIAAINECAAEVKVQPDVCDTAFEYIKCKRSKMHDHRE